MTPMQKRKQRMDLILERRLLTVTMANARRHVAEYEWSYEDEEHAYDSHVDDLIDEWKLERSGHD